MKRITKLLTNTKSTEIYSMIDIFIQEFDNSNVNTDQYLSEIIDLLKAEASKLKYAIARATTKSKQKENDKQRIKIFRSINNLLKGYLCHPNPEISSAAQKVYKVFKKCVPGVLNKGFSSKDAYINSLLKDFSDDSFKDSINTLSGLRELLESLASAQNKFELELLDFIEQKASEKGKDSATKIGKETLGIINKKLVTYLNAMIAVNRKELEEFSSFIGSVIKENNIVVKKRAGKRKLNDSDKA